MTKDEEKISSEATKYVLENKKKIVSHFADLDTFPSFDAAFTIFMAGSPGAAKTEFSKKYIKAIYELYPDIKVVRLDADEIRSLIPQYTGSNSYLIQSAAIKGVEKIFDFCQKHKQNVIVDGTFASYPVSRKDVIRAVSRKRSVDIFYLYQDPIIAWEFTKKREILEGRNVSRDVFINAYFFAKENVNKIKKELGDKITLTVILMDRNNNSFKSYFNVALVDNYIKIPYNKQELEKILV
jgi:glutaredoxin-related protein